MKKYLVLFIVLMVCVSVQAQTEIKTNPPKGDTEQMQTLFGNTGRIGWWVSPDFAWTQIQNKDAFLCGLSGGIIIKHSFSMGLFGYGIVNSKNLSYVGINDTANVYLYGGYGGFKMEYRLSPLKEFNIAFPLLIGGGGVSYSTMNAQDWSHDNGSDMQTYIWDSYFVIEPGVSLGINMLKFMRLDIGGSYRYAPGIELPRTDNDLLNGFNVNLSLKFGRF